MGLLMMFRVREKGGFENPKVDPPLIPWSRAWPAQTVEPNELLAVVCCRLEQDEGSMTV